MKNLVHIGVLGAARITKDALIVPAQQISGVYVDAVAARDPERAQAQATKFGIRRVHSSYEDLIADDDLTAVYIPLPAALHGKWTMAALSHGKHVLVEKPFAANAAEAQLVADAGIQSDLIVMEAHHTTYHPLVARLKEIIDSGVLGRVHAAAANFRVPVPPGSDIRWNIALGGGSMMDVGCYPLRLLLDLFGCEPTVESATAQTRGEIDRSMRATLSFDSVLATIDCSIWSPRIFSAGLIIDCDLGRVSVRMPYHAHQGGSIRVHGPTLHARERTSRRSTYSFQLEAFRDAITLGKPYQTDAHAAVRTMGVIDDIYRAAGLQPRQPFRAKQWT